jgi:hypothetical protein
MEALFKFPPILQLCPQASGSFTYLLGMERVVPKGGRGNLLFQLAEPGFLGG